MIKSVNYKEYPSMDYIRIEPKDKAMVPVLLEIFKDVLHPHEDVHCNSKTSVYIRKTY